MRGTDRLAIRRERVWRSLALVLAGCAACSAPASAAPGDLDPAFSGDGRLVSDLGRGDSRGAAVLRQPDGRLIVAGSRADRYFGIGSVRDFALARFNADGSPDATFSDDGRQSTAVSAQDDRATAAALQADGKLVVAGSAVGEDPDFAVARYLANGTLDGTFAGGGIRLTDVSELDEASGVAVAADGKIVVVGTVVSGAETDVAVARYDAGGSLDPTFSGDGIQTTDLGGADRAAGVVLGADGTIVVAGTAQGNLFAVVRYTSDGTPDASFSGDGVQTTNVHPPHGGWAGAVALASGGKVVVAGGTSLNEIAVVRYDSAGALDATFSDDGIQTTPDARGVGVAVAGDDTVTVVASTIFQGSVLARYDADGDPDSTLGGDGTQAASDDGTPAAIALEPGGRIVTAGSAGFYSASHDLTVMRHEADGTPDATFSGDGAQTTEFAGAGADEAGAVAIAPGGRIVTAGASDSDQAGDLVLAAFTPDGAPDTSFSADGVATDDRVSTPHGLAVAPDGRIVAGGHSDGDLAVMRFEAAGAPDPTFGDGGLRRTDFGGFGERATAAAVAADGTIVVAGSGTDSPVALNADVLLARYEPDGTPDVTFSGDGRQVTDSGGEDSAQALALAAGGKVVVVGSATNSGPTITVSDVLVARYDADGTLDTTFSGDGLQTVDFGGIDRGAAVAVASDGRIVVGATAREGASSDLAVARLSPDGTLDASFSGDGKQTTDVRGGADSAGGVVLLPGDAIAVAGSAGGGDRDFALARYTAAGTLDTSFAGDGVQTTDFAGSTDRALALALAADGRLVAAGSATPADNPNFAVARYENGAPPVVTPPPPPPPPETPPPAPPPPIAPPGPPAAPKADAMAPRATLSARRTQRLAPSVVVGVACHDEPCVARIAATVQIARGATAKARNVKLAQVRRTLASGAKAKVKLPLSATLRRSIRRALIQGRRVTVRVQARVADAAGNETTLTYAVRLRR